MGRRGLDSVCVYVWLTRPRLANLALHNPDPRLTAALLYANEASPNRRSRTRSGSGQRRRNDVPCKFFNMGKCARGDGCRFAHVLVTKEAQEGPGAQTAEYAIIRSVSYYFAFGPAGAAYVSCKRARNG